MANRQSQIRNFQLHASELQEELDNLIEELQEAFDNMPENLQYAERGDKAQERIDTLTEWSDQLSDMASEEEV